MLLLKVTPSDCLGCNCNGHAYSCHFDSAVFELTGNVTGGVCDNCLHNTQGRNCEECIPFFFHDPAYDIQDPNACQRKQKILRSIMLQQWLVLVNFFKGLKLPKFCSLRL